jgi:hypothetical protein
MGHLALAMYETVLPITWNLILQSVKNIYPILKQKWDVEGTSRPGLC